MQLLHAHLQRIAQLGRAGQRALRPLRRSEQRLFQPLAVLAQLLHPHPETPASDNANVLLS